MNPDPNLRDALKDTLELLIARATELRHERADFDRGVLMGYFEAINTILEQLDAFGIGREEVGLNGFNPLTLLSPACQTA